MPPVEGQGTDPSVTDLLTIIDAMVHQQCGGPAGFKGHVAIGIRSAGGDRWWRGVFGQTMEFGFVDTPSRDADAIFLMGASDARSLLQSGAFPQKPELSLLCGDHRVMERFLKRFTLGPASVLSVRCSE